MYINSIKISKILFYVISAILIILVCKNINIKIGIVYGKENAPIEIINYSSFQCSACTKMHEELGESIKKYIDSGQIKYIEKQIDIKRFEYDDVIYKHMNEEQISDFDKLSEIYEKQEKWIVLKSPEEVIKFLNLEQEENKKHVKDLKKTNKEKNKLEIKAVPTMFINGERIEGNISKEEFENKIESLLNKK